MWTMENAGFGNCSFVKDNNETAVFHYSGQFQILSGVIFIKLGIK